MAAPAAGQKVRAADFDGHGGDAEAANDTGATTTYTGGTTHGAVFTAPTSGAVWIDWGGQLGSNHTVITHAANLTVQAREGSVIGSGALVLAAADSNAARFYKPDTVAAYRYGQVSNAFLLTGLTPGQEYNVQTLYRAIAGNAGVANRWVRVAPAFA